MPSIALEDIKFFAIQSKFTEERDKNFRFIITNNHPFVQTITNRLNDLNDVIANPYTSPHNIIQVDALRPFSLTRSGDYSLIANLQAKRMTEHEYNRTQVWHNRGIIHLVYHRNKMGIVLLGDFVHEMEHSSQDNGFGYTEEEQTLLKINHACYVAPEENYAQYQNNYSEIWARIHEAQMYVHAYHAIKDDAEFQHEDKTTYLRVSQKLHDHITKNITQSGILALITAQRAQITKLTDEQLEKIFPEISDRIEKQTKIDVFMSNTGRKLHLEALSELNATLNELSSVISELQQDIAMHNRQLSLRETERIITDYAIKNKIPVKSLQAFAHRPPLTLYFNNDNYRVHIQEALKSFDHPVLTYDAYGTICIVGFPKQIEKQDATLEEDIEIASGVVRHNTQQVDIVDNADAHDSYSQLDIGIDTPDDER